MKMTSKYSIIPSSFKIFLKLSIILSNFQTLYLEKFKSHTKTLTLFRLQKSRASPIPQQMAYRHHRLGTSSSGNIIDKFNFENYRKYTCSPSRENPVARRTITMTPSNYPHWPGRAVSRIYTKVREDYTIQTSSRRRLRRGGRASDNLRVFPNNWLDDHRHGPGRVLRRGSGRRVRARADRLNAQQNHPVNFVPSREAGRGSP